MSSRCYNTLAAIAAFAGLVALVCSCRLAVRDVVKVVSQIPIGVCRVQARQVLLVVYSAQATKAWKSSYALTGATLAVTSELTQDAKRLIAGHTRRGDYIRIYQPDLFDKRSIAFVDRIGLAAESSEGSGGVTLFYDAQTNYVGFLAHSTARERRSEGLLCWLGTSGLLQLMFMI